MAKAELEERQMVRKRKKDHEKNKKREVKYDSNFQKRWELFQKKRDREEGEIEEEE